MLLTALPPAPPTPHTMMRGFNSFSSGGFKSIGIPCLAFVEHPPTPFLTPPVDMLSQGNRFSASADPRATSGSIGRASRPSRNPIHAGSPRLRGRLLVVMVNIRFNGAAIPGSDRRRQRKRSGPRDRARPRVARGRKGAAERQAGLGDACNSRAQIVGVADGHDSFNVGPERGS
jgi:hypothetical protein